VQILVAVANFQMRNLKTEVEKGSIGTVIDYGLVGPKSTGNSVYKMQKNYLIQSEIVRD